MCAMAGSSGSTSMGGPGEFYTRHASAALEGGGGKAKAFTPAEVKAGRATKLTTAQVRARREALFSKVRPQ